MLQPAATCRDILQPPPNMAVMARPQTICYPTFSAQPAGVRPQRPPLVVVAVAAVVTAVVDLFVAVGCRP
eukprot:330594-Chlamydomonas_euryale.AAC.6